jgi:hypothetical protein
MTRVIPLTILPLIAYNLAGYGVSGADPWATELLAVPMPSGARWSVRLGDLLILFAITMLYFELMKAAGSPARSVARHAMSILVLIVYLVELVTVGVAAHSVFFILTAIALLDVVAGFSISAVRRDLARVQDVDEAV